MDRQAYFWNVRGERNFIFNFITFSVIREPLMIRLHFITDVFFSRHTLNSKLDNFNNNSLPIQIAYTKSDDSLW